MKALFLCLSLALISLPLRAENAYVVFAKGDFSLVDATNPVAKPALASKAIFLGQVQAVLAQPSPAFDTLMTLTPPPAPRWGKVLPGATGTLRFREVFKGGMIVRVQLTGLAPGQVYRLCLNGNPQLVGNERLTDPVPGNPEEKFYDFFTATADADGRFEALFAIALPLGPYDVRFYVKDTADHTIFLYHDYFRFRVE